MKGQEVQTALHAGRSLLEWILANGKAPPVTPFSEDLLWYVEGLNDAGTKPEAFFTIRLLDSVAFGCETGIPHRIDGRDPVPCASLVAWALGAWAEWKGRVLVIGLAFVRQSRLVLTLHIVPRYISLAQPARIASMLSGTGRASGEQQQDYC